jgi:hypothetical protein
MNKLRIIFSVLLLVVSTSTFAQFGKLVDKAKSAIINGNTDGANPSEIANALKQALEIGASKSADLLSASNGFFGNQSVKIFFPLEAQKAEATLRKLGLNQMCDDAILSFNRAAEDAAKTAKPIFVNAIKNMSIKDATNILMGSKDAATTYFKNNTSDSLSKVFSPIVDDSIEKVGATKYYGAAVERYNKVPFVTKINPDLKAYITEMAIEGLFKEIAKEELKIRENKALRNTELMRKVFAMADGK